MPPRLDGCPLEDSQCSACQLALSASSSFWLINICEKDLGTPGSVTTIETAAAPETIPKDFNFTLDQVNYCIEMCEDTFNV